MGKHLGPPAELLHFTGLEYLYLSRYPGFNFSLLPQDDALQVLDLDYMNITDLVGLSACANLHVLRLVECRKLISLRGIEELGEVLAVDIVLCNNVKSLAPLAALESLKSFGVEMRSIPSLDCFATMEGLRELYLTVKVESKSLDPIRELGLKRLAIMGNSFRKADIERFREENPRCEITVM